MDGKGIYMELYKKILDLWRSYPINSIHDLDKYLESFKVLFAYNSGKIENNEITYHDTREIFENGRISNFNGDPNTLFEQQNQKLCHEYIKRKIAVKEPLGTKFIKEIHNILTMGTYDEKRYIEKS